MIKLSKALSAWQSSTFKGILKDEIEQLDAETLPLQQGLTQGDYAVGDNFSTMIISASETPNCIRVKAGVFYTSITAGCSCADDPTPIAEFSEYCEVQFDIDRITAHTQVSLFPGC